MRLPPVSPNTGGYCRARQRLPEALLSGLACERGDGLSRLAGPEHLFHGRSVKVVDGSSVSMPDTRANQESFLQPTGQKKGCGFPVAAILGVFCLATGAALGLEIGPWVSADLSLFRGLRGLIGRGDILLADRAFCSFAELALAVQRGADVLMRLHCRRKPDFSRGRILGLQDHIATWTRPDRRPPGLPQEDYELLPDTLDVREIRYRVEAHGFRTRSVTLATTLTDPSLYPVEELAALYARRWDVELDFRHIKTTLGMEVVRGRTPAMVRKEIWAYLLAYNLVRSWIWQAAGESGALPLRISFKGTIQQLGAWQGLFRACTVGTTRSHVQALLGFVGQQIVPSRPSRVEPRVRKRRPKIYPLMTRPRQELRDLLGAGA